PDARSAMPLAKAAETNAMKRTLGALPLTAFGAVCLLLSHAVPAGAVADGPSFWRVVGVAYNDVPNIRLGPSAATRTVGIVPPATRELPSPGCTATPTSDGYERMTPAQQARAGDNRWCLTRLTGVEGWARGKFLAEDDKAQTQLGSECSYAGAGSAP